MSVLPLSFVLFGSISSRLILPRHFPIPSRPAPLYSVLFRLVSFSVIFPFCPSCPVSFFSVFSAPFRPVLIPSCFALSRCYVSFRFASLRWAPVARSSAVIPTCFPALCCCIPVPDELLLYGAYMLLFLSLHLQPHWLVDRAAPDNVGYYNLRDSSNTLAQFVAF